VVSGHTTPQLRQPLPIPLNRLPFVSFDHFPLPGLSLTTLSEEVPGISPIDAITTKIILNDLDIPAREGGGPPFNRRRQIQRKLQQRDERFCRVHVAVGRRGGSGVGATKYDFLQSRIC
jgi:hypothetical protein